MRPFPPTFRTTKGGLTKISYDPHVDAAYIRFRKGRFQVTTHRLTEDVAVNYAPDGSIVGIEVLEASRYLVKHKQPQGQATSGTQPQGHLTVRRHPGILAMPMVHYHLTAVIWKEGNRYVSKCPELGVASYGSTPEQARAALGEAVSLYLMNAKRLGLLADVDPVLRAETRYTTPLEIALA